MKLDSFTVAAFIAGLPLSLITSGALGMPEEQQDSGCAQCDPSQDHSVQTELALEHIAEALITALPTEERNKIIAKGGIGSEGYDPAKDMSRETLEEGQTVTQWAQGKLDELDKHSMTDKQVEMISTIARSIDEGIEIPPICYTPGTNGDYIRIIDQMLYGFNPMAFHQFARWPRTAISGTGLEQGDPTVLTYSFVIDGTFIPNGGFGSGNSQTFAWLNSLYGSPAVWQDLFAQVFERWEESTGTSYVYEPNDDGVSLSSSFGVLGVRGDIRIASMVLDGNSGVLGYNQFPDDGDMVLDAFDSFYDNTSGNSLRFRNVVGHEHGHGLGMAHVCPLNETRLMEPIVTVAFDGPQLDDILNGHRHYGDPLEPNDDNTEATDLGTMVVGQNINFDNVSIDDPDDVDYFKINLTAPSLITFTVTPDAAIYDNREQDFENGNPNQAFCSTVDNIENYNAKHDLAINVYNSDDFVNSLQFAESQFLGSPETMVFAALEAREYWFEVIGISIDENVQRYRVDIDAGFLLSFDGDFPTHVDPGVDNSFSVQIDPFEQIVEAGSEMIFFRSGPGAYSSLPLMPEKGIEYTATLPGFDCDPDGEVEYYIQASLAGSGAVTTFPPGGGNDPLTALVGNPSPFFSDTFETDLGWTIGGNVSGQSSGEWERGVPAGDGSRGDPTTDGDGSGSCYLTGNGGPGSNTDVDNGETILISQMFDLSSVVRPSVSYWRWFDNTGSGLGSGASEDVFRVEITDGSIDPKTLELVWTPLETIGPDTLDSKGGWFFADLDLAYALDGFHDFNHATTQMQLRFIAEDLVNASVIEAAVDGVDVSELACQDPQPVISLAAEPASEMPPGEDFSFEVLIDEPIDQVVPGSESLFYLTTVPEGQRGGFIEVPLVSNGGNSYTATIPAQDCNPNHHTLPDGAGDVSYFLQVEGVTTGITTFPDTETEDLLGINVGLPMLVLHDNFELDTGWTVSGGAKSPFDGMWERGVPLGDGTRGDPTVDGDGSGQCFVTGNTVGAANSDVDGQTILTSPVFDILDLIAPEIEFYRWYDNTGAGGGAFPGSDVMEIGISYDGGEFYETLDTVGPNNADSIGGWIHSVLQLDAFGPGSSMMRVRFIVTDQGAGSVIEAGIDGVTISGLECENVVACPADLNNDEELDFFDVSLFLIAFGNSDPLADFDGDGQFDFFDVSAFLIAFSAGCP